MNNNKNYSNFLHNLLEYHGTLELIVDGMTNDLVCNVSIYSNIFHIAMFSFLLLLYPSPSVSKSDILLVSQMKPGIGSVW